MPITRATVTMNKQSQVAADAVVNVWHFQHLLDLDQSHANKLIFGLTGFYERLSVHLGNSISRGSISTVQLSTLTPAGEGPGDDSSSVVQWASNWGLLTVGAGTVPLPAEVAICLSFRGDTEGIPEEQGATRPASRRKGRVFIGPWQANSSTLTEEATTFRPRVAAALMTAILNSYETSVTFWNAINGTFGTVDRIRHIVYSPTSSLVHTVVSASVDDAFDTVRSRGEPAVFSSVRAINQPAI